MSDDEKINQPNAEPENLQQAFLSAENGENITMKLTHVKATLIAFTFFLF